MGVRLASMTESSGVVSSIYCGGKWPDRG